MKYVKFDPKQFNILLVDDSSDNLRLLSNVLTDAGYKVRRAISGQMALKAMRSRPFDLVMLDINMPEMDGYEVCRQIKANSETENIPILFISALSETIDKIKAFEVGGADYITKPFRYEEVIARVEHQIRILTLNRELERTNISLSQEIRQKDQKLEKASLELELSRKRLLEYSLIDPVTNLDNKVALMGKLKRLLEMNNDVEETLSDSLQDRQLTLYLIRYYVSRLNNNLLELDIEDLLIDCIASNIADNFPDNICFARLNYNEFVIVYDRTCDSLQADLLAKKLQQKFSDPLQIDTEKINVKIDYGIVTINNRNKTAESIIREARVLCHQSCQLNNTKQEKNKDLIKSIMQSEKRESAILVQDFKQAFKQQKLLLLYQPIISLKNYLIEEVEVFFAYHNANQLKIITQEKMEEFYQNQEIGEFLLKFALKKIKYDLERWRERIIWDRKLQNMDTNIVFRLKIPESLLLNQKSILQLHKIVQTLELEAKNLVVEIPEYLLFSDRRQAVIGGLLKLHRYKFNLALDNLSLKYLAFSDRYGFPIHSVKVSTLEIDPIQQNKQKQRIIEKILDSIDDLNINKAIAIIDTPQQLQYFQKLGCQQGIGKFFALPTSGNRFDNLITDRPWLDSNMRAGASSPDSSGR